MADSRFHANAGPFFLVQLAALTDGAFSSEFAQRQVDDVASLADAQSNHIAYIESKKHLTVLSQTQAGIVCVRPDFVSYVPPSTASLITPTPHLTFVKIAELFYPIPLIETSIHDTAVVASSALIGQGSQIDAYTVIGPGVIIGDNCKIASHVTISHSIIGNNVRILPGARIGQEGFGFITEQQTGLHRQVPQLGRVLIEDYVVIGANVTIDRGALSDTIVRRGAIIDNLVQIGHNCDIGAGAILVSQSGIAGSSRMGQYAILAAQAGIADHLSIGDFAQVGAKAGVMRDVPAHGKVMGSPAMPVKEFFRQVTTLAKLGKTGK